MTYVMMAWTLVGFLAAPMPEVPGPEQVLSTLRKEHPRLIATREDMERVRQLIKTDARVKGLRDRVKNSADAVLDEPPIEHVLIGPRLLDKSRTCLSRVLRLALMYRLEGDERYARRAEKEMLTAAAFPDWNPSHFLDTAEMSNALGIGYDWLYDYLSPESRTTIRDAIINLGLKPSVNIYEKNRWWAAGTNNWNQVCNGGLTVGALAIADEQPKLAGYVVSQASKSIRRPTARLAPDGGWDEGPGYWHYAMAYTAFYIAGMRSALGTDFGLSDMPGMAETGLFRIYFRGPSGLVFNYADASEGGGSAPEMYLFARLFDRPVYAAHQRQFLRNGDALDLVWYDPRGQEADLLKLPLDVRFQNVDVAFLRSSWGDDTLFVGFKGGDNHNGGFHAHLDLGTFVLDNGGVRWASDLGADEYNMPGYFGAKRFTYYRLRTEGQNTLVINGDNQDLKAKAPLVAFNSEKNRAGVVADLTQAYRKHAKAVRRGVALVDRKYVLFEDEIEAAAGAAARVEWVMHTKAAVQINGNDVVLKLQGQTLNLRALAAAGGKWSVAPAKVEPPQRPLSGVNRLVLQCTADQPLIRLAVVVWPGDGPAPTPELQPLAEWKGGE